MELELGLGRRFSPDDRDDNWPIRPLLAAPAALTADQQAAVERGWRYWHANGAWLYQGRTGTCVAHAWVHYREDGPETHPGPPDVDPFELYRAIVLRDVWPENDREAAGPISGMQFGTSVRAGAQEMKARGYISEYRWTRDVDVLVRTLLTIGPVVMGTIWTDAMMRWDAEGVIRYDGGRADQGHAYVANGVNTHRGLLRLKAWGHKAVGRNGHLWLPLEDAGRLIRDNGEVCLAVETPTA